MIKACFDNNIVTKGSTLDRVKLKPLLERERERERERDTNRLEEHGNFQT